MEARHVRGGRITCAGAAPHEPAIYRDLFRRDNRERTSRVLNTVLHESRNTTRPTQPGKNFLQSSSLRPRPRLSCPLYLLALSPNARLVSVSSRLIFPRFTTVYFDVSLSFFFPFSSFPLFLSFSSSPFLFGYSSIERWVDSEGRRLPRCSSLHGSRDVFSRHSR